MKLPAIRSLRTRMLLLFLPPIVVAIAVLTFLAISARHGPGEGVPLRADRSHRPGAGPRVRRHRRQGDDARALHGHGDGERRRPRPSGGRGHGPALLPPQPRRARDVRRLRAERLRRGRRRAPRRAGQRREGPLRPVLDDADAAVPPGGLVGPGGERVLDRAARHPQAGGRRAVHVGRPTAHELHRADHARRPVRRHLRRRPLARIHRRRDRQGPHPRLRLRDARQPHRHLRRGPAREAAGHEAGRAGDEAQGRRLARAAATSRPAAAARPRRPTPSPARTSS